MHKMHHFYLKIAKIAQRLGHHRQTPLPSAARGIATRPPAFGVWRRYPQTPVGLRRLRVPTPDLRQPPSFLRNPGYATGWKCVTVN